MGHSRAGLSSARATYYVTRERVAMFASAADARFLVASMPTSVPDLELPTVKVPRSDVLAALLAAVLGQWMVSWAWQHGGYYQLAAAWLCIELAFYAYNCWRCAAQPATVQATPTFRNGCRSAVVPWEGTRCYSIVWDIMLCCFGTLQPTRAHPGHLDCQRQTACW